MAAAHETPERDTAPALRAVPPPDGYTTCPDCQRPILDALFAAHQRREAGVAWTDRRRPVRAPGAGKGSRSRSDTEGRGRTRPRWKEG